MDTETMMTATILPGLTATGGLVMAVIRSGGANRPCGWLHPHRMNRVPVVFADGSGRAYEGHHAP